MGTTFEETLIDEEDEKDMDNLIEDLESTKQLLELEVRSKKLLEKDNKRLAQELEKLKMEMLKGVNPVLASDQAASAAETTGQEEMAKVRRNSVALKRHSVIRLLSESESHDNVQAEEPITTEPIKDEDEDEEEEEEEEEDEISEPVAKADSFYDEELAEIEEMREEVDEARKLAEEWEAKYKEMQRQMSDLDGSRYKKHSLIIDNVPMQIQKKAAVAASASTEFEGT